MPVQKIMIKTLSGEPIAALTLPSRPAQPPLLPSGLTIRLYEVKNHVFPFEETSLLSLCKEKEYSLLGIYRGQTVFASTRKGEQACFAKWQLLQAECPVPIQNLPTIPLEQDAEPTASSEAPCPQEQTESQTKSQAEVPPESPPESPSEVPPESPSEVPPTPKQDLLTRISELAERATPFPLFEELMPGSKWVIAEESEGTLIGVLDEQPPHLLLGIPGTRECPPSEEGATAFFPTDDTGEVGYYLKELTEESVGE